MPFLCCYSVICVGLHRQKGLQEHIQPNEARSQAGFSRIRQPLQAGSTHIHMAMAAMVQNQWDPILEVNSPPTLEPILVVGLNRMFFLGANRFGF